MPDLRPTKPDQDAIEVNREDRQGIADVLEQAGFERVGPHELRSHGIALRVGSYEPSEWGTTRSTIRLDDVEEDQDERARILVVADAAVRALRRSGANASGTGPVAGELPWSAADRAPLELDGVPPPGSPHHLWSSPPWVRKAWATPRRRMGLALLFAGTPAVVTVAALLLRNPSSGRTPWLAVACLPLMVWLFAPVAAGAVRDERRGTNTYPRGWSELGAVRIAVAAVAGVALVVLVQWLRTLVHE